MTKTRIPTQKRSLEKYEKIIAAAYKLFNEKGYYNTTTTDIAKESGVAIGSIYSYFLDKKEIYMEILKRISDKFEAPTHDFWTQKGSIAAMDEQEIKALFKIFIEIMMECHNFSKLFHDDMMALELLDEDIAKIKKQNENIRNQRTRDVFDIISIPFHTPEGSDIFLHYCNLLIDDVCHTILYDEAVPDKEIYLQQTVDLLYKSFQNLADF